MLARRLVLLLLCLAALGPALARKALRHPAPAPPCVPEGRGVPPRGWVGCAADGGPPRDLTGRERLALGLPLDLNRATVQDLESVPGLNRGLAEAAVALRAARGPYRAVEDLLEVRGIGPGRLGKARAHLAVGGEPEGSR